MRTNASVAWSVGVAAAVVLTAAPLRAQRELFTWSGKVDQEIELTVNGRNVTTSKLGPSESGERRLNIVSAMPREDGQVTVQVLDGRGTADVVRQPTAENGYTAVIRVRDPKGGSGMYRIEADWQPVAAGELGPPFDRDRSVNRGEGRLALQWSGDVDDDLEITLSPSGVSYNTRHGDEPRDVRSSFKGLPSDVSRVNVVQRDGRDPVVVIQQPSPDNGNTAIIRIRDSEDGYDHYSFDILWR